MRPFLGSIFLISLLNPSNAQVPADEHFRLETVAEDFADGKKLDTPIPLIEVPRDRENATCHEGGSLAFGPDGCLDLSTGDNTCPFKSNGSAK